MVRNVNKKRLLYALLGLIMLLLWALYSGAAIPRDAQHFQVLTWNVGNAGEKRPTLEQVATEIGKFGHPEIILLQEVGSEQWLKECARQLDYPFFAKNYPGRGCDTAILSDYPLTPESSFAFPAPYFSGNAILARAATPWGEIVVGSVHFPAIPKDRARDGTVYFRWKDTGRMLWNELTADTERLQAAQKLLQECKRLDRSRILVGGDFNTLSMAKPLRMIRDDFSDAAWLGPTMFAGTYVKVEHDLWPRIDYIFHGTGFKARNGRVGQVAPGDHLPVCTTMYVVP